VSGSVWSAPFYELDGQLAIALPDARAVFTTVSAGDVRETADAIGERLGVRLARAKQVHGSAVISVAGPTAPLKDADAIVTTTPGLAPMVLTADCVPIVIAGGGAVAAVHAGWKGLRDGVIAAAVEELRAVAADNDAPLVAAIGPSAGSCCYEVGEDLHEVFAARGEDFRDGDNLDLHAIAARQLRDAGVARVIDSKICTICSDPAVFFSHRRDNGQTGRQGALVWLT